jgi:lipoprotein-anchoring transpeptidase ErfK/SrfK
MRSPTLAACLSLSALMLAACQDADRSASDDQQETPAAEPQGADTMASRDPSPGEATQQGIPDSEERPMMQAQVVLDRLGFSTGVIDGKESPSFTRAIEAFQEARELPVTGKLDDGTRQALGEWSNIAATRVVTIPQDWAGLTFTSLPDGAAEQAKLTQLGYESMAEKLAERFHTTPEVLATLNPGGQPAGAAVAASPSAAPSAQGSGAPPATRATPTAVAFAPGQQIRVPNVGGDRIEPARVKNADWLTTLRSLGVGTSQPEVTRIVVDESEGWLRAYDDSDRMVAAFSVTTGSEHDPLPIGDWKVKGVAYNPPFAYNPELFWDVDDSEAKQQLPPGPNGPVGVVWIDLDKEHYGIHGTPEPALIGQTQSHGCVRLTNWDAARLAQMVSGGTKVVFRK